MCQLPITKHKGKIGKLAHDSFRSVGSEEACSIVVILHGATASSGRARHGAECPLSRQIHESACNASPSRCNLVIPNADMPFHGWNDGLQHHLSYKCPNCCCVGLEYIPRRIFKLGLILTPADL